MEKFDDLAQLQQKIAMKTGLEAKQRELMRQRNKFHGDVVSLRVAYRKEQEDVDKLELRSLANYFYQVIGKLDEKLDQERQEAYAAKVKLDAAERELAGIEEDLQQIQKQLTDIHIAQDQYQYQLQKKRSELNTLDSTVAAKIEEIEHQISALMAQKQEVREAVSAGSDARRIADRILSELDSADGWNTWDLLGGGGVITHMAKHGHLDEAQDLVSLLQSQLRCFKTELADIQIESSMQVNTEGFLRFADYFFDGLFVDWAMKEKISQSQGSVSSTKHQIAKVLDQLKEIESQIDKELAALKATQEDLLVNA